MGISLMERPRVLIEDADGASSWATERVLTRSGYQVETCPGPEQVEGGCPLVSDGRCDKFEQADVVLYALGSSGHDVLAAERRVAPYLPLVIEGLPNELGALGHLTEGAVTVSRVVTGRGINAAVASALAGRNA